MRCIVCQKWGKLLCQQCFPNLTLGKRLVDAMPVYSFYAFSDIELLLHYKYTAIGSRIFSLLAQRASAYFVREVRDLDNVYGVGIDDNVQKGYSHTGVIMDAFRYCGIRPCYGELLAKNPISYAGKSLEYRQKNPKNFQTKLKNKNLVIFDDVITTGTSLREAKKLLESCNNTVLFGLTLCDARR